MQFTDIQENQNSFNRIQASGESIEKISMHPDDFAAHLAWVTAKRSHENILGKTFADRVPKFYWIFG